MWGIQQKFWACVTIKQEVWHIMAPWANTTTLHSIIITRSCSSLFLLLAFLAGKILARKSIEKITTFLTLQTQNKEDVVTPFESMSHYRRGFLPSFQVEQVHKRGFNQRAKGWWKSSYRSELRNFELNYCCDGVFQRHHHLVAHGASKTLPLANFE